MIKNVKKGIITTVFGILFLLADLFYFIYPMIFESKEETNNIALIIVAVIGLGLLISPDTLFSKAIELKDKL